MRISVRLAVGSPRTSRATGGDDGDDPRHRNGGSSCLGNIIRIGFERSNAIGARNRALPIRRGAGNKYARALEAHIDAMQRDNPKLSREAARRKVIASGKGGTLLLQHERALGEADHQVS